MIIGGSKKEVIKNIQKNILENELNKKVEVGDPILTDEEINKALNNFFENKKKKDYKLKKKAALKIVKESTKYVDNIEVVGIEKLKNLDLSQGAIITNNHFNPLDSYASRKVTSLLNKKLYIKNNRF